MIGERGARLGLSAPLASLLVAALCLLAVATPRPAVADGGGGVKGSLSGLLRDRGLIPTRIYACGKGAQGTVACHFEASGKLPDGGDFQCAGEAALHKGRWSLTPCYARLLWGRLLKRDVKHASISGCLLPEAGRVECRWSAHGTWPGSVPYRCEGEARFFVAARHWQIDKCVNELGAIEPLAKKPGPEPVFGFNDNWLQRDLWHYLANAHAIGAETERVALPWGPVERSPGSYDFSHMDAVYEHMRAAGAKPLWILGGPPCWAQDDPGLCRKLDPATAATYPPAPDKLDEFADFAVAAAKRYPGSEGFEIWNEPNHSHFFHHPSPERYGQIVRTLARRLSAATKIPVIAAGINPLKVDTPSLELISDANFLRRVYASGGFGPVDALAYHVYWGDPGGYRLEIRRAFARIYGVMDHYKDDRPLWVTEVGADSGSMYSPARQATVLVDVLQMLRRIRRIPVVVVHRFVDAGRDSHGALTAAGKAKPLYCALGLLRGEVPRFCH